MAVAGVVKADAYGLGAARVAPALFREICVFALGRYDGDRASYHVSAEAVRVPRLPDVPDAELDRLLDHFDALPNLADDGPGIASHERIPSQVLASFNRFEEE